MQLRKDGSGQDIQVFPDSGIWHKPLGAIRVDLVLQGGDAPGSVGESRSVSFPANELPDHVDVEIGKGGQPGTANGYALIVTQLREGQ